MAARVKSYDELAADAAKEWSVAQRKMQAELDDLHARLAQMPDVAGAPDPRDVWGHVGVECQKCSGEGFKVTRWVTVNGHRHRTEVACIACKKVGTWDWGTNKWID